MKRRLDRPLARLADAPPAAPAGASAPARLAAVDGAPDADAHRDLLDAPGLLDETLELPRAPGDLPATAARLQQLAARRTAHRVGQRRRRARLMTALGALATALAIAPLVAILAFLLVRGAAALTPALVVQSPTPGGEGGGLANGIVGSGIILAVAALLGLPVGLGAGLWLHERRGTRAAGVLRYLCDVLTGVPSIVFGIVAWGLLVRPVGHFSAWAGGVALAAMLVPIVARTTDELLALGFPRWRTALGVSLRAALPGVVTGALVALARIAGETAPLLFTAFGNQYWSTHPGRPIAALPLQVYVAALGASDAARRQAYAGALLLVAAIALFGFAARRSTRRARRAADWGA